MATAEMDAAKHLRLVLQGFMSYDYKGEQRLHADDFPKALQSLGLKFGDPVVDSVMPLCQIDADTGFVDFSNVAGEITRLEESARQREREQLRPQDTPASGKGVAFHAALAKATGVSGMPELPPELASLPQPARVRKLAGPLNQLFTQYDNGDMNSDVFRERLRAMGLRENLEVDRLLRQQGVTFSQLFKALAMQGGNDMPAEDQAAGQATDRTPSGGVFGTRHNALGATGQARRMGKRTGFKDLRAASAVDPVSWRGNVQDGTRVRKKKVGEFGGQHKRSTALDHERYMIKSDLQNRDTGASMSLYGRPIGSTAGVRPEEATNEGFFQGGKAGHSLPTESGAGAALWGYGHHGGYETQAQHTARAGLGQRGGPTTSAGYGSRDQGLLREQIYSAIRLLDRGGIDTAEFRIRLKRLGCEMPAEVDRLLVEYQGNGRATFKTFVRAFEKYFTERAAAAAKRHSQGQGQARNGSGGGGGGGGSAARGSAGRGGDSRRRNRYSLEPEREEASPTTGYMDRSHLTTFTHDETPAAMRTHGDILTWRNNPPITLEEHRAMVRDGVRPGQKRRTHGSRRLAAGRPCTTDDETRAPVVRLSRKWTSPEKSRRGAGNIIQWASGEFKDPEGNPMPTTAGRDVSTTLPGYGGARGGSAGDVLPDGTCSGRGRARPETRITRKEARRETPFGTDKDLHSPTADTNVTGSRKAFISSPTLRGGDWMNHDVQRDVLKAPVVTEPAPWNKELSEYEL